MRYMMELLKKRQIERPNRSGLYMMVVLLMIVGCKSQRVVNEKVETSQCDVSTERSKDYERDSIIVHDSVIVFAHADTVYKERWRTEYKDRVVTKTDTVVQEVERVVEKVVTDDGLRVTGYRLRVIGYGLLVLLVVGVLFAVRIVVRRFLRV